jgi:small subunit ribosomal protein S16
MSLVIRLHRVGRRNQPGYRISVADSRFPTDGRTLEDLGVYQPLARDAAAESRVDVERARHWLGVGARTSETVHSIFKRLGVYAPAAPAKPRERTRKSSTATRKRRDAAAAARAAAKAERRAGRLAARRAAAKAAGAAKPEGEAAS